MDRSCYNQQMRLALAHTRRKLVMYGAPLTVAQLSIVIVGFIVFQSYPERALIYFAIAVPVYVAALCLWVVPMSKAFARHAPCCPVCHKTVRFLNWRKATTTGLCPHCQGTLFGP